MTVDSVKNDYLKYLLDGKRKEASLLCNQFLDEGNSIKYLYESIMKPALYEVGHLWEQNKISVAAEHLATAITEGILNSLYSQIIPDKYIGNKIVLACVDKEEHQVGIKMVADIFEMNGWESFFLGTGFPTSELVKYIEEIKPQLLALSLSVYFNYKRFLSMLNSLKEHFPDLPILVGGQAFRHIPNKKFQGNEGIFYFSDLNELDIFINKQTSL